MTLKASVPNVLTIARVFCIPVVVAGGLMGGRFGEWLAFLAFVSACITDGLDGYYARAWKTVSAFGRFLDPVADKLLVGSTLLLLTSVGKITGYHVWAAVIILCREILVSGLREYLADIRVQLPVTQLAKWKTTLQMIALACLLIHRHTWGYPIWSMIGYFGLWTGSVLSLITGYHYVRTMSHHLRR